MPNCLTASSIEFFKNDTLCNLFSLNLYSQFLSCYCLVSMVPYLIIILSCLVPLLSELSFSVLMACVVRESVKIVLSCENISEHTVHILYSRLQQLLGSRVTLEHVNTTRDGEGGQQNFNYLCVN